ncbi:SapC family protein [Sphingobium sp. H39-3-25]|uniref:SapC family protein n=1 Tax=Sphingobium arseniciresistens TaxID=3030834 RepID=UPI0023B96C1A|nr:SapC family protein [Sphingobium arseniciresistens]
MTDSVSQTAPAADQPLLPLFYKSVQPLHGAAHASWRLKDGDASFADDTPFVPIVAGELASAARDYPVVFAADSAQPLAILGLERRNLFIEGGRWSADAYIPAYVRRYPFAFVATVNPDGFALAIDTGSERVVEAGEEGDDEGAALFENGEPSALTRQALEFCAAFGREVELTALFTTALKEKDLLIDRRADATLPDGRKLGLDGFQIVDAEKLAALDDETVVAWHRQGILALVHHHLASLDRFTLLLNRQALVSADEPVMQTSFADGSAVAANPEAETTSPPADAPAPAAPKSKKA